MREYIQGDVVRLSQDAGHPNLTLGKDYTVVDRTYRGGHADCYVLEVVGDNGKMSELHEDWFVLSKRDRKLF